MPRKIINPYTKREPNELLHLTRLKNDLKYFFHFVVRPALYGEDGVYYYSKSFELQCDYAVAVLNGKVKRLSVEIPPRNSKSQIWSVALPMWEWLTNPAHKFISVSHHDDVLKQFHSDRKLVFNHPDYQRIAKYSLTTNTTSDFRNDGGGHVLSMVMGFIVLGLGAQTIIVDDPISANDKDNPITLKKAWNKFTGTLMSRLNDKANGAIIVVSQRLAEGDISWNVVKNGDYVQLKLPSIQVEKVEHVFPTSKEKWVREPGDVLNPKYESLEVLNSLKKLDPTNFEAQYQQEPITQGNGTIEHEGIKRYFKVRDEYLKIVMSVDSASSVSERAAKWGITVWGLYYENGKMHFDLLYAHAKKYEYPAGKKLVLELGDRWKVTEHLIENKSTGTSLIPELKEKNLIVTQMSPTKDKITRMMSVAHLINLGYIHVPDINKLPFTEGWLNIWLREIQGFPNSVDRDLVDSTSQLLSKYGAVKLDLAAFYRLNRSEAV